VAVAPSEPGPDRTVARPGRLDEVPWSRTDLLLGLLVFASERFLAMSGSPEKLVQAAPVFGFALLVVAHFADLLVPLLLGIKHRFILALRPAGWREVAGDILIAVPIAFMTLFASAMLVAGLNALTGLGLDNSMVRDFAERAATQPGLKVFFAVEALVMAPVVEEVFFRGFLLWALRPLAGMRAAIVTQALLFACAHYWSLGAILATLPAGLVLGYLAAARRSLWICIGIHFAFNLPASLLVLYGVAT
jgi:membrane protease YdiL (CAAX protease family)